MINATRPMPIITFLSLLFLVLSGTTVAQDQSAYQKKIFIAANGDTLLYRILFPENYDSTRAYPLVLFLHGAGERGRDNEKQLVHGASLFEKEDVRKRFPAIVLFPQCPQESYWSSVQVDRSKMPVSLDFDYARPMTAPLASALELTRELIRNERADRSRVYIMGLSMGGMGTFEAVHRFPKLFAAAAPICGGGDAAHYSRTIRRVPFWVFHGTDDAVVSVEQSRKMVKRLKELRANVRYTEYPGVNHNSWDNAFAEADLLPWLFSHQR